MTVKPQNLWAQAREVRRLAALLCLALFAAVHVLAACEPLHHAVHADAAAPDHDCAVTLLESGGLTAPEPVVFAVGQFRTVLAQAEPSSPAISSAAFSLAPTRGPPVG